MAGSSFLKDPQARLDYHIDWTAWLAGDLIVASTWDVDPVLAVTIDANSLTSLVTSVWLSGGVAGSVAALRNHITTQEGREEDRTIYVYLLHR